MKGKHVTIGMVLAVAAGVSGVYGFADDIGFQIDRFAFKSEVVEVDQRHQQIVGIPLRYVLTIRLRELLEVELRIAKYKQAGMVPSIGLIQEAELLRYEIEMIRRELDRR